LEDELGESLEVNLGVATIHLGTLQIRIVYEIFDVISLDFWEILKDLEVVQESEGLE